MDWKETSVLIEAAKGGDRGAFEEIVRRYTEPVASAIRSQAGKKLRERVEVEDLVQETFLRVLRSIGQFRGGTERAFRRWLASIAAHVIQSQARRIKARQGLELSLDQKLGAEGKESWELGALLQAQGVSPSKLLRQDERFERLKRVLGTLSPDHSKVIFLARVQGLPIKEVARRMERTPEATSMLLLRALMKLKAAFGNTESFHLPDRSLEEGRNGN